MVKSKVPHSQYLEWIENFMKLECETIIFGNSESLDAITHHFKPIGDNFKLVYLDMSDFEMSKYNHWNTSEDVEGHPGHSVELYK